MAMSLVLMGVLVVLLLMFMLLMTWKEGPLFWQEIRNLGMLVQEPWLMFGDFNNVLFTEDRIGGLPVTDVECVDFREAIGAAQLQYLSYIGWAYTWGNQQAGNLIYTRYSKLSKYCAE